MKVIIDPGHGGTDPGAVYGGTKEEDIALAFALSLGHEMRTLGIDTAFTRTEDRFIPVMSRADTVKTGDVFVSCHVNSCADTKPNGLSVWYHGTSNAGKQLASHVFHAIESLGYLHKYGAGVISDRTRYANGFGVLREATDRKACGAIMIELGFLPNRNDRTVITNSQKRNIIAQATAKAIRDFILSAA